MSTSGNFYVHYINYSNSDFIFVFTLTIQKSTFCFYFNPSAKYYCATFLAIHPNMVNQSTPQLFSKLCLFSCQVFQLGNEVHEYLSRIAFLLDERFQFLKPIMLFAVKSTQLIFFSRLFFLIQCHTRILTNEVCKILCNNRHLLLQLFLFGIKCFSLADCTGQAFL